MNRVRNLTRGREIARFAVAVPVLVVLDSMIRTLGVRPTERTLRRLVPLRVASTGEDPTVGREVTQVALALDRAAARVCRWHGRCLRRSLALWVWLRLNGVDADVRIGVRREGQALVGHAWVSCDGRPVAEPAEMLAGVVHFGDITTG